jgi:hypothetical protein
MAKRRARARRWGRWARRRERAWFTSPVRWKSQRRRRLAAAVEMTEGR